MSIEHTRRLVTGPFTALQEYIQEDKLTLVAYRVTCRVANNYATVYACGCACEASHTYVFILILSHFHLSFDVWSSTKGGVNVSYANKA